MSQAAPAASPPHLRLSPAEKNLVEAIAAAIGSLSATWLFFPLDTLKTRLQAAVPGPDGAPPPEGDSLLSVWRHLVRGCPARRARRAPRRRSALSAPRRDVPPQKRTEGAAALYRGIGVKTAHSVLQSFVYFYCFATLRSAAEARAGGRLGVAATLAVGTLAGWCNVLITEPLDTIATTKQARLRRRRAIRRGAAALSLCGCAFGVGLTRVPRPRAPLQISRHRSQLALAGADGAACGAGDAPGAAPAAKKGRATPSVGLYRSLWVSLLLTCNPALQARARGGALHPPHQRRR